MNIAVVNLTGGGFSGGYRKYLAELIPRLRAHRDVARLDNFVPPGAAAAPGDRTWPARDALLGYRSLRADVAALRPDVVFIPTQRWFDTGPVPSVVMVRNMEPLEVPFGGNAIGESVKNIVRAHTALRACERASRVIAVSQHVRDFLTRRWNLDPRRIGVVYHGTDDAASIAPAALATTRAFLFTAGSIRPARGLEELIAALPDVPNLTLVIAGGVDRGAEHYDASLRMLARTLGVEDRVLFAGKLDRAAMAAHFRAASLFVMTSRAEACPNIAIEAMTYGALVVSGDNAPMPEFFRDAARYYEPRNARSLASAIRETLALPESRQQALRERGRAIAREFDWDRTADATLRELRQVIR